MTLFPARPCENCNLDCGCAARVKDLYKHIYYEFNSTYVSPNLLKRLNGALISSYAQLEREGGFDVSSDFALLSKEERMRLALSCFFDFSCNIEYISRIPTNGWFYCNRDDRHSLYYSFLKVCPYCSIVKGKVDKTSVLERTDGEKRKLKPSSEHTGEISQIIVRLHLELLCKSNNPLFKVAANNKKTHEVDLVIHSDNLLILGELKASPLVIYPLATDLPENLTISNENGDLVPAPNHFKTDNHLSQSNAYIYLPHVEKKFPLGRREQHDETLGKWPYPEIIQQIDTTFVQDIIDSWYKIYRAYVVKKTRRGESDKKLTYMTLGEGGQTDDNKNKAGLGRSDDLKKGTYQMLKLGAYYKDQCKARKIKTSLISNFDPAHQWETYLKDLVNINWTQKANIVELPNKEILEVAAKNMHNLYDSIVTYNRMIINDRELSEVFSYDTLINKLVNGKMDYMIQEWIK